MTLIEVLVALALVSLLSIGLFAAFRTVQRSHAQVVDRQASAREVLAAQRVLRRLIEAAYPLEPSGAKKRFGLEGEESEFLTTAAAPLHTILGLYRYEVSAVSRRDGSKDLLVRFAVDRNGVTDSGAVIGEDHSAGEEVLLAGIRRVEFSYMSSSDTLRADGSIVPPSWTSSWQKHTKLPALVKVDVRFPDADRRSWPSLVAAPRITANAHCQFDAVAQSCRVDQP